jgi:hypothetical protein
MAATKASRLHRSTDMFTCTPPVPKIAPRIAPTFVNQTCEPGLRPFAGAPTAITGLANSPAPYQIGLPMRASAGTNSQAFTIALYFCFAPSRVSHLRA